jgi:hypothetical protein
MARFRARMPEAELATGRIKRPVLRQDLSRWQVVVLAALMVGGVDVFGRRLSPDGAGASYSQRRPQELSPLCFLRSLEGLLTRRY